MRSHAIAASSQDYVMSVYGLMATCNQEVLYIALGQTNSLMCIAQDSPKTARSTATQVMEQAQRDQAWAWTGCGGPPMQIGSVLRGRPQLSELSAMLTTHQPCQEFHGNHVLIIG